MSENIEVKEKYETCKLRVVKGGKVDKALFVYPAVLKDEVIDLDRNDGIYRWTEIQRILSDGIPRGMAVPAPIALAGNHRDPAIPDSDIPKATLMEGFVLEAPRAESDEGTVKHNWSSRTAQLERQVEDQAKKLDKLMEMNEALLTIKKEAREEEGRKPVEDSEITDVKLFCGAEGCDKSFKRQGTLDTHKEKFHA